MKRFHNSLALVALFVVGLTGCQPAGSGSGGTPTTATGAKDADHDHADHDQDHPHTVKEGFEELTKRYATIKAAFEGDDREAAHDDLHQVAHLLDHGFSEVLDGDKSLDAEVKKKITELLSELFDEFTKLDGQLHDDKSVDFKFADVDTAISTKLEELKGLIP